MLTSFARIRALIKKTSSQTEAIEIAWKNVFDYLTSEFVHYGYVSFTAQVPGVDPKICWSKYTHSFFVS